ncbi:unnamed protein product [Rotaria magnacalcarata]
MQCAVDIVRKILKYKEILSSCIQEIAEIYRDVYDLTIESFYKYCNIIANIATATFEQVNIVETAFDNVIVFIKFCTTLDRITKESLLPEVMRKLWDTFNNVKEYFSEKSENYKAAIVDIHTAELKEVMGIFQRWNGFLQKLKNFCTKNKSEPVKEFSDAITKIVLYEDMCAELEKKVNYLKSQLNVELITEETKLFVGKRDSFFINLMELVNRLRTINAELKDFLLATFNLEKLEGQVKSKIQVLGNQLLKLASQKELSLTECDNFRINYNHLLSIVAHVDLKGIDVKTSFLDKSEKNILENVISLSENIENSLSNVEEVAKSLCQMKFLAENLSMFDTKINAQIDKELNLFRTQQGALGIDQLVMILEKTEIGSQLIQEQTCFIGENWRKRREKMQKQDDLNYVLDNLKGNDVDEDVKNVLKENYQTFRSKYEELIARFLGSFDSMTDTEPNIDKLVTETKALVGEVPRTFLTTNLDLFKRHKTPELLAHIFAVWTLKNTQHYNESRGIKASQAFLLMPHVGQVIAIFRILGIGYKKNKEFLGFNTSIKKVTTDNLINNLVQIGTGEGKSVVMAVTACVFALNGMDVKCSCYSEYLSTRDQNDFSSVFSTLKIEKQIEYGTFNKLCENLLNEQCNVREQVRDIIMKNQNIMHANLATASSRPKVLLIDEVDVFLSEKFYGGIYTPSLLLIDFSISMLLNTLWQNRDLHSLNAVEALPAYQTCVKKFSNWDFLLEEATKDMLVALRSFHSSTYIVKNDRIVYVEGESIAENVVRGYDTVWAYYYENQNGKISQASLNANTGIIVNCGVFSYAEMPHEFVFITGVTGTLETLAKPEKSILKNVYHIQKNTIMPSVFGKSNRNYNSANDVYAVEKSEYFMRIRGEIGVMRNAGRGILVFFESEEKLMAFYNSYEMSAIKETVQIITEKVSHKERELCIKRAATDGKVTLLTRVFGRGTDFICRNQQVLANGGIHVLQTFFSEELSEEYQIMGRGARQGDSGSYRMIILDSDLEWVLGPNWEKEIPKITGSILYNSLNEARDQRYESKCAARGVGIEQCRLDHEESIKFKNALSTGEIGIVKSFLTEQNRGPELVVDISRTILLMDATGSMSSLLSATKDTVCTMFERASAILNEKRLANVAIQMQFVVYRDYDCKANGILQSSSWEKNPTKLRSFMSNISAYGGGDYEEAIEIGLWHAVQQSAEPEGISQVILIGDAPAKSSVAIERDRKAVGGESYWNKTKFRNPTHYTDELRKLKAKNIHVHAFYLHNGAKVNFEEIAHDTGGSCRSLEINSPGGVELLTHFITEELLRKAAGKQGNAAVELYKEKYVKKTFTS